MGRAVVGVGTLVFVLAAGACASDDSDEPAFVVVGDTVALGELPEPLTPSEPPLTPPTVAPSTTEPAAVTEPITSPVGAVVEGNRVLLIGDSALATITPRREGIGCQVLSDLGWQVQIEAEPARYLPFADDVIDAVVVDSGDEWDVVGLMFGHVVDTPVDEFGSELDRVLGRFGGRPVLLYTVAEEGDETATALNGAIRERGESMPNVLVIDWGAAVASEEVADLVGDDRVPTEAGMSRLVVLTAAALGEAPTSGGAGSCLDARFNDDSAIVVDS